MTFSIVEGFVPITWTSLSAIDVDCGSHRRHHTYRVRCWFQVSTVARQVIGVKIVRTG